MTMRWLRRWRYVEELECRARLSPSDGWIWAWSWRADSPGAEGSSKTMVFVVIGAMTGQINGQSPRYV